MRVVFLGSGEFGVPTLERLARDHQLVGVVTQPDRPAGRHRQPTPTSIAQWATDHNLPVLKTDNVNTDAFIATIRDLRPDAGIVIAFGQKLGPVLIDALGHLAVNLHGSLLPKYRGAAPINWAIINGETVTGLSVITLAQRMDAGLIYGQASTPIDPLETAGELHDRLALLGPDLIARVLDDFAAGRLNGQAQDESQATRAPKLSKADSRIDFSQDAYKVAARVHGLTPWPGVHVAWHSPNALPRELILRRVRPEPDLSCFIPAGRPRGPAPGTILEGQRVAVGDGAIHLLEVQLPGGKPLEITNFIRGHPMMATDRLEG